MPTAADPVLILATSRDPVITSAMGTQFCQTAILTQNAKLTIQAGGRLDIPQNTLADILGNGLLIFGEIANSGTINIGSASGSIQENGVFLFPGGIFNNSGTVNLDHHRKAGIHVLGAATLNNLANGQINIGQNVPFAAVCMFAEQGGTIVNSGTITAGNNTNAYGLHLNQGGIFNNQAGGILTLDKANNTLVIENGLPNLPSSFNNRGTVTLDETYTAIQINTGTNSFHNHSTGQLSMGASYQVNNGLLMQTTEPNNTFINDGSLSIDRIDLLYGGGFSGTGVFASNGTFVNNGYWKVNSEFVVNGNGGTFTIGPCGLLEVNGGRILTFGRLTNNGFLIHNYNGNIFSDIDGVNNGAISHNRNRNIGGIESNNNGIIMKPRSGNCTIPNVFTISQNNTFNIAPSLYFDTAGNDQAA
ncbi:MAG: hypothetical protein R3B47_14975, partial [Bacteroidia bacterium]